MRNSTRQEAAKSSCRPTKQNSCRRSRMGALRLSTTCSRFSAAENREQVVESLRAPIRERLHEFCFVGLQEDFAASCRVLFRILGRACPEERADHSVEKLAAVHSHIRKLAKPAISAPADQAMAALIELDAFVYEEAGCLYSERLGVQ